MTTIGPARETLGGLAGAGSIATEERHELLLIAEAFTLNSSGTSTMGAGGISFVYFCDDAPRAFVPRFGCIAEPIGTLKTA